MGERGERFPLLSWETVIPFLPSPFPEIPSAPCTDMSLLLGARPGRRALGVGCSWAVTRDGIEGLWDATAPPCDDPSSDAGCADWA